MNHESCLSLMDKESNAYCSNAAIPASPSKSSSACSSPLPFSALSPITTTSGAPRKYSMEEVWRDITPSSDLHHAISPSATSSDRTLQGSAIQDFLSRLPPDRKRRARAGHSTGHGHGGQHSPFAGSDNGFLGSRTPRVAPMLSLNSRTEIHCVEGSHDPPSVKPQLQTIHDAFGKAPCSFTLSRLDALNYSSTVEFSISRKKRIPESDDSTSGHRNKRMMKNRESAARSRARKQAYTTELELEVSRLIEENARLRRQMEKLCAAAAPAQSPQKQTLHRTLTAPF